MTEREERFLKDCKLLLGVINASTDFDPAARMLCVNALSRQIRQLENVPTDPQANPGKPMTLIGLTFADIIQMQNGGNIEVSAENLRADFGLSIFLGGTEEHMRKGLEKHPDVEGKLFDSHGDKKN